MHTHRSRWTAASIAAAVLAALALPASPAAAAEGPVAPDAGPTAGGTSVQIEATHSQKVIKQIAPGAASIILFEDGTANAFGLGSQGTLGNGSLEDAATPVAVSVPDGRRFTQVANGYFHVIAIDQDGALWSWGRDTAGELGIGREWGGIEPLPLRVHAPDGVRFVEVAADGQMSFALTDTGDLWSWGVNSGSLGLGEDIRGRVNVPMKVSLPEPVVSFGTTFDHGIAALASGAMYGWGDNRFGQVGNKDFVKKYWSPAPMTVPDGVTFPGPVQTGSEVSYSKGSDGIWYGWGNNTYGELGPNGSNMINADPVALVVPDGVDLLDITSRINSAAGHTADGSVYTWGRGRYGQLGNGSDANTNVPGRIDVDNVDHVIAGGGPYFLALSAPDIVVGWGTESYIDLKSKVPVPLHSYGVADVASVTFDGVPAVSFEQPVDGKVAAVAPAHVSGVFDVEVVWSDGHRNTYADAFTFGTPPVVTVDPQSQTVEPGVDVTFTADATGDETPTVQWQKHAAGSTGWVDVDGAAERTLVVAAADVTDDDAYRAVFSNGLGSVTTAPALIDLPGGPVVVVVNDIDDQSHVIDDTVEVQVQASASDGSALTHSVSGLPAGLAIDSATGLITGAPTEVGVSAVTATATAPTGESASTTFTWTVTQTPARIIVLVDAIPDQSNLVGDTVELPVVASASDGSALNYSAAGLPDGLSIDAVTGVMSGSPSAVGVHEVTAMATAVGGESDSTTFTWTVTAPGGGDEDPDPKPSPGPVAPATAGPDLANTGANIAGALSIAALAVASGFGLLIARRRRDA